ncbi:MAG: TonB-dependent receptor plug domain-containing protein [Gammaproteobacteria bacterium]|nr:TonB-dependent receptor plug domain-containing protein [Gammaproteobacteria bacterium]
MPTVALAQDGGRLIEEVVVTGSRIRRADLESVSPVSIVTSEELTISGIMNVEQKLAELPQSLPSFGSASNNPGDGTARVDLRGLGTSRTLVLVNGRRYMPSTQTGVVDLNTIPASLIESVDVVTGGASAVYGSDALAGVVNFKLKDDFEGVEVNALYDITEEGDAEKYNLDLTIGGNFADGRGNAVVHAQFSDRNALFADERDDTSVALVDGTNAAGNPALVPGGSSGIPGTRLFGGPHGGPRWRSGIRRRIHPGPLPARRQRRGIRLAR